MNKEDVLFLDVYRSIRGSWAGGIVNRGNFLVFFVEKTTLSGDLKKFFKKHFKQMVKSFKSEARYFDGREWARDTNNSYDDLMEDKKWYDEKYYKKYSIYEKENGWEEFEDLFPAFTAHDYAGNYMKPMMMATSMGAEPTANYRGLDDHSKDDLEKTTLNVLKFLYGDSIEEALRGNLSG